MGRLLEAEYEVEMTGCIRLGRVGLNSVIRAVPETQSMEIEADQHHVTMVLREVGLDASICKGKDSTVVKMTSQELEAIGNKKKSYLVRGPSVHVTGDEDILPHSGQRGPSGECQAHGISNEGAKRGDHAGEPLRRRSSTGAFTVLGNHCLRGQSNWLSTVALSSGESEDLGLELGVQIVGKPDVSLEIHSGSSAARAFAEREGLCKQKHVQTRLLWIQEQVEQGEIGIQRVGARDCRRQRSRRAYQTCLGRERGEETLIFLGL
eukprot:5228508-Amphidinium_carterae.1